MRLDKFLQISRLVKRRTIANTLCSRGAVSVNGHIAKAGKMLTVGDVIRLPHPNGEEAPEPEYEVLELPFWERFTCPCHSTLSSDRPVASIS